MRIAVAGEGGYFGFHLIGQLLTGYFPFVAYPKQNKAAAGICQGCNIAVDPGSLFLLEFHSKALAFRY